MPKTATLCLGPSPSQKSGWPLHYFSGGGIGQAPIYISAFRRRHTLEGFPLSDALLLEIRDSTRALRRGLGPPKRAQPLYLEKVAKYAELQKKGPMGMIAYGAMVGLWWMLREVELAALCSNHISTQPCDPVTGGGFATLNLPISKMDIQALGKKRTHQCICPDPL